MTQNYEDNVIIGVIQSVQDSRSYNTNKWTIVVLDSRIKRGSRGINNKIKLTVYNKSLMDKLQVGYTLKFEVSIEGTEYTNKKTRQKDIFNEVIINQIKEV